MVEPIALEFKIDDIYIDNPLLSKNDLLKYDTEYCYEKVTKEIDKFIKAQLNFPNIKKPTITCNYEVRYECFVPRKVDKVGDYVTKKITQEEQIRELYSEITSSLKFLSKLEFKYFLICLYYKESQAEFMGATRTSFYQIKDSCVVKMAGAMGYTKEIQNQYSEMTILFLLSLKWSRKKNLNKIKKVRWSNGTN